MNVLPVIATKEYGVMRQSNSVTLCYCSTCSTRSPSTTRAFSLSSFLVKYSCNPPSCCNLAPCFSSFVDCFVKPPPASCIFRNCFDWIPCSRSYRSANAVIQNWGGISDLFDSSVHRVSYDCDLLLLIETKKSANRLVLCCGIPLGLEQMHPIGHGETIQPIS